MTDLELTHYLEKDLKCPKCGNDRTIHTALISFPMPQSFSCSCGFALGANQRQNPYAGITQKELDAKQKTEVEFMRGLKCPKCGEAYYEGTEREDGSVIIRCCHCNFESKDRKQWENSNEMPKLKAGMVVEFEDGGKKIILSSGLLDHIFPGLAALSLNKISLNKTCGVHCSNADHLIISRIVKIYDVDAEIIWQRREPKEMTVAEISKELGYSVKVVEG